MPQSLHPYYLQQIGIEAWTIRKPQIQTIKLMVIGEALEAHGLFNNMLNSIGLSSEDVCIKSSLSSDLPQQITTNPPQMLLVLGRVAIQYLLNQTQPLSALRQKIHDYHGTPLIVSYHPADLLEHPADKKYAYHDLLNIQHILKQNPC